MQNKQEPLQKTVKCNSITTYKKVTIHWQYYWKELLCILVGAWKQKKGGLTKTCGSAKK